jgi:diadenosine tetraphosphate (Ap4A) HIT family hydrolase
VFARQGDAGRLPGNATADDAYAQSRSLSRIRASEYAEGDPAQGWDMVDFVLHERLAADTVFVADWPLSSMLLMNDARYPWLILVPRRVSVVELFELSPDDRGVLMGEVAKASELLKTATRAAKINIGALGNLVPQLHIHVVARNPGDAAWPGPVWGNGVAVPYEAPARDALLAVLRLR